jgi:predicted nucleic-acid-binding protein
MLGIDTNVLLRLLVADDAAQTRRARQLVEDALAQDVEVLVSLLVLTEAEWVLRSRYDLDKQTILNALGRLLEARDLAFEDESAIEEALFHWKDSALGFTDCLIAAQKTGGSAAEPRRRSTPGPHANPASWKPEPGCTR